MGICDSMVRLRREKGWTQSELAKLTGLSRRYIAAIEEGRISPKLKTLLKTLAIIAEKPGICIEELEGGRDIDKDCQ